MLPFFIIAELDEPNTELSDLMEQFREQATKLIDMLDLSLPAVVRLKVRNFEYLLFLMVNF